MIVFLTSILTRTHACSITSVTWPTISPSSYTYYIGEQTSLVITPLAPTTSTTGSCGTITISYSYATVDATLFSIVSSTGVFTVSTTD